MPFHGQKRFTPDNWFLTWVAEESDSERKSNGKRSLPSKEARGYTRDTQSPPRADRYCLTSVSTVSRRGEHRTVAKFAAGAATSCTERRLKPRTHLRVIPSSRILQRFEIIE